jgi:recombination protein RecT
LARRSGQISTIYASVVHEKDEYKVEKGLEPKITHVPHEGADHGKVRAAYAVCRLRDGGVQMESMWVHEIEAVRKRSRAGESGPWVTDYEEMAKKTVLRRLCKLLPASIELQTAVTLDEQVEAGIPQDIDVMTGVTDPSAGKDVGRADALKDELAEKPEPDIEEAKRKAAEALKARAAARPKNADDPAF